MIIIHIGLKRSGSGSIQEFLNVNDNALRRLRIDYPRVGRWRRPSHSNFAQELKGRKQFAPGQNGLADLVEHWRSEPSEFKIISTERFEFLDAVEIQSLKTSLSQVSADFRIVLYTRNLAEVIRSIYAQRIRLGQKTYDFDRFFDVQMEEGRLDDFATAQAWAEVFGWENIRVRCVDEGHLVNGDLTDDFLATAGLDPNERRLQAMVRPGRSNVSSGWRVLEAMRALHKGRIRLAPSHPLARFMSRVDRWFDQVCVESAAIEVGERRSWMQDKGLYLTRPQAQRCLEIQSGAIAALNRRLNEPLPMPPDLDGQNFKARDFLPDAKHINKGELKRFYHDMGVFFASGGDAGGDYSIRAQYPHAPRGADAGDPALDPPTLDGPVSGGKRFAIHIGLKKSGSASIQSFLAANDEALRSLSVDYALVGRQTRTFMGTPSVGRKAHHNLASEVMDRGKFDAKFGTWSELVYHAQCTPNILTIISSEMFEGCEPNHVKNLWNLLAESGRPTTIILLIRDLLSLIPSSYAQKIRYGVHNYDFDTFFEARIDETRVDYFSTAKTWADVFGWNNIKIRLLDSAHLTNGDLIDDFLSAIGVDLDDPRVRALPRMGRVNETSGWKILEATRALYSGAHGLAEQHPLVEFMTAKKRRFYKKRFEEVALDVGGRMGWAGDKGRYLTRGQAQQALGLYAAAIEALNEHLTEPLPLPGELDARGFVERDFLPQAGRIDAEELGLFYNEVGAVLGLDEPEENILQAKREARRSAYELNFDDS
jgi:hypothetical protein